MKLEVINLAVKEFKAGHAEIANNILSIISHDIYKDFYDESYLRKYGVELSTEVLFHSIDSVSKEEYSKENAVKVINKAIEILLYNYSGENGRLNVLKDIRDKTRVIILSDCIYRLRKMVITCFNREL